MKIPVLIPRIFDYPHTYLSGKFDKLKPGSIVSVPFGKEIETGVIWDKTEETNRKFKIRTILKKNEVSFKENLVDFINWFSLYNLVPKGMVLKMFLGDKSFIEKGTQKYPQINIRVKNNFNLNVEQKKCLKEINSFGNKFNVTLLQGITGSGKTIVYFEKIKEIMKKNKQALVLLPEIFLTNQFNKRFEEYFGFKPAIWHSKISKKLSFSCLEEIIIAISLLKGGRFFSFLKYVSSSRNFS